MRLLGSVGIVLALASPAGASPTRLGNLVIDGVPELSAATALRMNQYQNTRAAGVVGFETNGKSLLISTRFAEVPQIHVVAGPGADRRQLTFFSEPVRGAAVDPKQGTRGFYFAMDSGGNEFTQLYWFDRGTGKHTLLTDGKSRNDGLLVAEGGGRIAFASTRRNGRDFDIYTLDGVDPASTRLVAQVEGRWNAASWSRDDRELLLQHFVSANESHLYTLDLGTGVRTEVNPAPGKQIAYVSPVFSRTGRGVYYASDEDGEFLGLTHLDLKTGTKRGLRPDLHWDIDSIAVSRDGKWLAYTANEGGKFGLYLAATPAGPVPTRTTAIPVPKGEVRGLAFDRAGRRLAMSINTSDSPGDAYVLDLATLKLTRWTTSEVGGLDPKTFVLPSLIEYPSFDGRQIPTWIYRPTRSQRTRVPVVINIHGGPEGQTTAAFSALTQYFVNELGVAVIAPNVRGSSGYGKNYLLLDNGKRREDSVKDIGALLDFIARQPDLDGARVAVTGGSYGGYMVLASLATYAGKIRCGVDMVGISNFVSFLERTEAYRRDLRRAEYGDERQPEMRAFLSAISPLTNVAKIKAPLLVGQGQNDPRVPQKEAEQIVASARKAGNQVWYVLATDEGHGFQRKVNRDYFQSATSLFLETCLLP
jgi:dipeptidyl aminopeptidase/acylaminoacyl peptidase